jgi:hypothetical protein
MTPTERTLRGRIGAYALHAQRDAKETTAKARATFLQRFEAEVDPEGVLAPDERHRRAQAARKCYFAKLGLLAAKKKRKKNVKNKKPTG